MYGGWSVTEENILTLDVRFISSTVAFVKQYHTASEINILQIPICGLGQCSWYSNLPRVVWVSNPGEGNILHTHPDHHGVHPASHIMGGGSFSGVKWLRPSVDHTPLPSSKVKETVQLYPSVQLHPYSTLCLHGRLLYFTNTVGGSVE